MTTAMQRLVIGKTRLPGFGGKWTKRRLGDLADIDPENLPANTDPDHEFNYISLEQVEAGRLRGYTVEIFRTSPSRARRRLRRDDVLMSTVRPNLMGHLLFDFNNEQFPNTVCSTGFAVLRCKRNLSVPGFLFAHLFGPVVNKQIERILAGSNYPAISSQDVALIEIPCPSIQEQAAIAAVLSDMDRLLESLDAVIAKKRAAKMAAMQQLLTGKTRLPGFLGIWSEKPLINLAAVIMGQSPSSIFYNLHREGLPLIQGNADIENRRTIDRIWTTQTSKYCDPGDLLLTVRAPVGYVAVASTKACLGRGVCGVKPFGDSAFLFHALRHAESRWQILEQGSTFTAANSEQVKQFRLRVPEDTSEQRAIAAVLSDMDAEIAALEQQRDKTRALKQGMMQQLLTGKIRLAGSVQTTTRQASSASTGKGHNWQINEAVVISVLAGRFGNEEYPLSRMRYTKLSYLLHRHVEGRAEGYLKKAAGPYNPRTRYGGPENIAMKNHYVRRHGNGGYKGFIAGENIEKAQGYFSKWYGENCLKWLDQFRYERSGDLELLTTVDLAAEELREAGKDISVESVREAIRGDPEWQAKLNRSIFSDANISQAIDQYRMLFDPGHERPKL